jgi:hypothetical protein
MKGAGPAVAGVGVVDVSGVVDVVVEVVVVVVGAA